MTDYTTLPQLKLDFPCLGEIQNKGSDSKGQLQPGSTEEISTPGISGSKASQSFTRIGREELRMSERAHPYTHIYVSLYSLTRRTYSFSHLRVPFSEVSLHKRFSWTWRCKKDVGRSRMHTYLGLKLRRGKV